MNNQSKDQENPQEFEYMMLSRLQTDCEYFLGYGKGSERVLWAQSIDDQINEMKRLHGLLVEKPDWLSIEKIEDYARLMHDYKQKDSAHEWNFRMDWLRNNGYSPSNSYYWELSGKQYQEHVRLQALIPLVSDRFNGASVSDVRIDAEFGNVTATVNGLKNIDAGFVEDYESLKQGSEIQKEALPAHAILCMGKDALVIFERNTNGNSSQLSGTTLMLGESNNPSTMSNQEVLIERCYRSSKGGWMLDVRKIDDLPGNTFRINPNDYDSIKLLILVDSMENKEATEIFNQQKQAVLPDVKSIVANASKSGLNSDQTNDLKVSFRVILNRLHAHTVEDVKQSLLEKVSELYVSESGSAKHIAYAQLLTLIEDRFSPPKAGLEMVS